MIFFLVQMALKFRDKQDMNELIPSLMWVSPLVFAFGTQLYYLIHNDQLVLFIRNWKKLEVELNCLPNYKDQHERSQKIYSAVYLIKLILQCCLLTLYICLLVLPESVDHGWWTLPANVSSSRQLFMMHYKELCHYVHPIFFAACSHRFNDFRYSFCATGRSRPFFSLLSRSNGRSRTAERHSTNR